MFMQEFSYTILHVKCEDNVVADSLSRLCHDYLHDDDSEQALAHEAESVELIAAFLATQEMWNTSCRRLNGRQRKSTWMSTQMSTWMSDGDPGRRLRPVTKDLGLGALVPKIRTPCKGPFEVTQRENANTYRIRDLVSQRELEVNVSLFVPYHLHPLFATPLTVSVHGQEEWLVESVEDHEPHVISRHKRRLSFRVRFQGLPDTHYRMYPWAQLKSNPQLHAYLRANGFSRLMPTRFR
jgi:hypothetical protein